MRIYDYKIKFVIFIVSLLKQYWKFEGNLYLCPLKYNTKRHIHSIFKWLLSTDNFKGIERKNKIEKLKNI